MAEQAELFQLSDIERKFAEFDRENPSVWEAFKWFALDLRAKGYRRYSARDIFPLIRWRTAESMKGRTFKINNNFSAFYARKFHREFPEYGEFFELRKSEADGAFRSKQKELLDEAKP